MAITNPQTKYTVVKEFTVSALTDTGVATGDVNSLTPKTFKVGETVTVQEDLDDQKGVTGLYIIDNGIKYKKPLDDCLSQVLPQESTDTTEKLYFGMTKKKALIVGGILLVITCYLGYKYFKGRKLIKK